MLEWLLAIVGAFLLVKTEKEKTAANPVDGRPSVFGSPSHFRVWTTTFYDTTTATGKIDPASVAAASLPCDRIYMNKKISVRLPGNNWSLPIPILDRGPWYVSDNYFAEGVPPLAELVFASRNVKHPSGVPYIPMDAHTKQRLAAQAEPFRSRIPTQPAALDLTPAAWLLIPGWNGTDTSRWIDWKFVQ